MTELEKRIRYAIKVDEDFIAEKDGKYVSGKWEEEKYAKSCGWKVIGSVAKLAEQMNIDRRA